MGEEYGERAPFQFFTDHIDAEIADGHARGPPARVRGVRRVRRRGGARPAGPARRSSAPSSPAAASPRGCASSYRGCSRRAASSAARAEARVDFDEHARLAARAPRRARAAGQLRPRRRARAGRARGERRAGHARRDARARLRRPAAAVGSAGPMTEVWPGAAVPARRRPGTAGHELLALLRARRARRAVPVRRRRRRDARRADRAHRAQLALLPAGRRAGPALRLPRPRPVRPETGPPLQPGQAAASTRTRSRSRARSAATRPTCCPTCPTARRRRRPRARRRGRRRRDPEVRRDRPALRLGGRPPAEHAVARDRDLRDARQGLHASCTPTCARTCAAPTPGWPPSRRSSTSATSASPRSSCCRSTTSPTSRSCAERGLTNYWGYSHDRLPRAALAATPRPAATASRCASSRAWSRRCTARASR